ncbi:UL33 protein [Gallid alphaherpesvirus 3]|uniref:UL33 product homolog n=2 Tax=Gallid alphaherpesvirus 3 TaxID=35250 RepID=Q9WSY0_9ALPH|nr:DNA packaging protein UL33 [Gallid alphaherpesvirus 3]YP_010795630.1 UL33 protein [Gallid alphaherpesvirus 3]BAA78722.1 UL33 protein [Marek's disease virus serotype 2 MDV2]AEI00239.1 UL33 protein [Gallid alphaherpesvirus 3]QEY02289.1 UL33 protein [Gallid alphaherpesvirus 3]BAA82929.1 UL33 product homolog [Marek's disease virus serotype 2 MDV2]BAB16543.1 UL33 protein [Gallid alphaherpesvirus 3]
MAAETNTRQVDTPRLADAIPDVELLSDDVDKLAERYICDGIVYRVWFEYLIPDELDLIFPTTDGKFNYLSFTRRLASAIRHGRAGAGSATPTSFISAERVCDHGAVLRGRSERFASVINRFLDLHQILKDC